MKIVSVPAPEAEGELLSPVPADAPPMPETHVRHGQPAARWIYRDAAGLTLFAVLRFDRADGGKEFLPLTLWRDTQGLRWCWKSVPAPRPLYNLHKLAARSDAPVVICEGEKSADAAERIFPKSVATTSPSGANAADRSDWSVLRGRKVLVWPDDDAPGCAYARKVSAILAALDCDVSIIDAAALARTAPGGGLREPSKEGWDAADAITEWPDTSTLQRGVACAKPFDAADAAPAYVSFGKFKMDEDGLTETNEAVRQSKSKSCACPRPSRFWDLAESGRPRLGQILRWRDADGRLHEKFVSDEALQGDAAAICAPLAAEGLQIVRAQQREFANYLSGVQTTARVTVVHRTGWHEIDGESVFVLPDEIIGRKGVGRVLLDGAAHGPYERRGTLAEWSDGVAR